MRIRYHIPSRVYVHGEASEAEKVRLERALIAAIRRAVETSAVATAEIVAPNEIGAQEDAREHFSVVRYRPERGTYTVPSYDDGGASTEVPVEETQVGQRRSSLGTEWYVEMDPPSSIIPVGTEVTFRLRNADDKHFVVWEREGGKNRPLIAIRARLGAPESWVPRYPTYPVTLRHTFGQPGHFEVSFQGRPIQGVGPLGQPMALTITGSPIYVSAELDVVQHLTRAEVEAEPRIATYQEDVNRLNDPKASAPEIAQTFQRIAIRRGIEIVNQNKQETLDLLKLYTRGAPGLTAEQAVEELQRVLRFDSELQQEINRLRSMPLEVVLLMARRFGRELRGYDEIVAFRDERIERINLIRASLIDAFPALALGLRGGELLVLFRKGHPQAALEIWLRKVLQDCDTTRRALATGDLHVFDVPALVSELRQSLGIDADARKCRAVDEAVRRHEGSRLARSLGLAGASLTLLLVPGVGPYLAAAVGLIGAGIAWEHAADVLAAAGAGVHGGLIGADEASAVVFWAGVETLLAGFDAALAVRSLARVVPHVPAAVDRLVARMRRAARGTTGRQLAPELAAGFTRAHVGGFRRFLGKPMTHGDIELLGNLWRQAANPGEEATLTLANSRRLFNNHRRRFFTLVRGNPQARAIFEDAGCRFPGGPGTLPVYDLPDGQQIRMTVDHIIERQTNPGLALNPHNLRIVFERENTVMLRLIHQLDPFQ